MVEQQRLAAIRREAKDREEAQLLAQELSQLHLVFSRRAGQTGLLFGSVTTKDMGDLLAQQGIRLDRRAVLLEHPIKRIGNYNIPVQPHSQVQSELLVSVLVEESETVVRVLRKDQESQQIVQELESTLQQMDELSKARGPQGPIMRASEHSERG